VSLRDLVATALQDIGADVKSLIAADASLRTSAPRLARGPSFVPRVGWSVNGGVQIGTTTGTPSFQRATFTPFSVGPSGWQADAILFVVSTAYSGGTNVGFSVGLYPDDGTGFPNLAGGPIAQVSTTTLTAGTKTVTLGTPVDLTPGTLWVCTLVTGTAAPSAGQMQCLTNTAYQLALPAGIAPGTVARAYVLTGQTALPTSQPADSSFALAGGNDAPIINLRRSA